MLVNEKFRFLSEVFCQRTLKGKKTLQKGIRMKKNSFFEKNKRIIKFHLSKVMIKRKASTTRDTAQEKL